jgi:molecular chaperone DnaJ
VRFKELNASYQVLSDPQRRAMYDRLGHAAESPGSPFAGGGPFAGGVINMSDISVDGLLGDLLGVFGVGRGDRGNLKEELVVSFEEAAFGCDKPLTYQRLIACADCRATGAAPGTSAQRCRACDGTGRERVQPMPIPISIDRTCSQCRGTGRVVATPCPNCRGAAVARAPSSLVVTLPPGVENGDTKLVSGAGNRVRPERPPGDLEITVRVRPHPLFRREGDDVCCQVPITFAQAALGAEVVVPTLDGKGKLRVPPGTQPGALLRIKGKGIARKIGLGRGDQRVEVQVEVPTELTQRQRELMEQLAVELGEDVQPIQKSFMDKLRDLFG